MIGQRSRRVAGAVVTRWRGRRWAVITSVAGTVFIAAGAFWLSFTALADLARRAGIGEGQAWAWPLIVDGVIVVSTVAVVALAGERAAWYPWTLLIGGAAVSVTANALHAIVAADADVPAGLAAAVAAVPPVVLLASTHLTVVLIRTTTQPAAGAASVRESVALEAVPAEPPAVASPTLSWRGSSLRRGAGSSGAGGGAEGVGVVEQEDRPDARCASLDGGPLVRRRAPTR